MEHNGGTPPVGVGVDDAEEAYHTASRRCGQRRGRPRRVAGHGRCRL